MINSFKATALLAVAAGAATALTLVGTDSASAHTTRHTLRLTTHQLQDRIIGDVTSCRINTRTHIATCDIALSRSNGLLYAHVSTNVDTGRGKGKVVGGTRAFHGATGTVTAALPHVTIVWNN
jgi:hypothetical protein